MFIKVDGWVCLVFGCSVGDVGLVMVKFLFCVWELVIDLNVIMVILIWLIEFFLMDVVVFDIDELVCVLCIVVMFEGYVLVICGDIVYVCGDFS